MSEILWGIFWNRYKFFQGIILLFFKMRSRPQKGKKEMKMSFADSQHWRKCELKFDKCRICMGIIGKLGTELQNGN
jgi:hypothetical protein